MIDKTTSRVIMGLLGTACVLITAFAWYKTKYAAVPEAGMHHNIYDEDIPRSAPVPVDYRMVLLTPQELAKALWPMCLHRPSEMRMERLPMLPRVWGI